jgi:hypothetical protein
MGNNSVRSSYNDTKQDLLLNRPLGHSEKMYILLQHEAASGKVYSIDTYVGPLNPKMLRTALELLQYKHPILRLALTPNASNSYWLHSDLYFYEVCKTNMCQFLIDCHLLIRLMTLKSTLTLL